jgi:hypothetical protein
MATKYEKTFGATAYLTFNENQIALTAKDLQNPRFEYHAESFYTAASLGDLDTAVKKIAEKMKEVIGEDTVDAIKKAIDSLKDIPVLGQIVSGKLVITDFVINKPDMVYEFGLGLRLTENNKLGPVSLDGISILVTATGTPS